MKTADAGDLAQHQKTVEEVAPERTASTRILPT
jgi:hypothetical protein